MTYGDPYVTFSGNATADRLLVGQEGAGIWMVNLAFSVHSGGAPIQLSGGVYKNGTLLTRLLAHRYLSGTNDMGAAAASSLLALEAGDYLDVRFAARNAASRSIDLHYVNLSMHRVNHKR